MACPVVIVREIAEHKTLKRCATHGIAWVEDGTSGNGFSAHPNIHRSGNARAMYGRRARVVTCHGWTYNTDSLIVSGDLDRMAAEACRCGGAHS